MVKSEDLNGGVLDRSDPGFTGERCRGERYQARRGPERTFLIVSAGPQGMMPIRSLLRDWRDPQCRSLARIAGWHRIYNILKDAASNGHLWFRRVPTRHLITNEKETGTRKTRIQTWRFLQQCWILFPVLGGEDCQETQGYECRQI